MTDTVYILTSFSSDEISSDDDLESYEEYKEMKELVSNGVTVNDFSFK